MIPMSGISPQCTSRIDTREPGATILTSAPSAICAPPPMQLPWTAAITGAGRSCQP